MSPPHHHLSLSHFLSPPFFSNQTNETSTTTTISLYISSLNPSLSHLCAAEKKSKMCPLRLILVFLSATLAGFFILRNLNSKPDILLQTSPTTDEQVKPLVDDSDSPIIIPRSTKVLSAIGTGFWTCVDMASGRYLWNHLSSSGKKQS